MGGAGEMRGACPSEAQARVARECLDGASTVVADGGFGTGKTSALALAAGRLLEEGVPAGQIVLVTARRSRAEAARRALAAAGAGAVEAASALEVACGVLEGAGARRPRVALGFEEAALEEDLKTLGSRPRRLRELMKFLFKGLDDLADRDPGWLVTLEEERTLGLARSSMAEQGAMLWHEAAGLACERLEGLPQAGRPGWRYVLADDFSEMTRATQRMLSLLARDCLVVAGTPGAPDARPGRNPFPQGLEAAGEGRPGRAASVGLGEAPVRAPQVARAVWPTPAEELTGVAAWIAGRLEGGLPADELLAVVPNRVWGRRLAEELRGRGVACELLAGRGPLGADPRDPARNAAQKELCLKELALDEGDLLAWRSLCGFDDPLLGSQAWKELRGWADGRGEGLADALLGLAGRGGAAGAASTTGAAPFPAAGRLAERVRAGLEGARALEGAVSAEEVAAERLQAAEPAFGGLPGGRGGAVRIGTPDELAGAHARAVAACGLVDGFMPGRSCFDDRIPPDVKERSLARERAVFARMLRMADDELALTRFDHEMLEEAEPARMEIARIAARPEGRVAAIRPCAFLAERAGELGPERAGELAF